MLSMISKENELFLQNFCENNSACRGKVPLIFFLINKRKLKLRESPFEFFLEFFFMTLGFLFFFVTLGFF